MHYLKIYKLRIVFLLGFLLSCLTAVSQTPVPPAFAPRLPGGNIKVRGDVVFVGNNTLNQAPLATPSAANTPYNGTDDNNNLNMEYIDIDSDGSTFSSSSADLALTSNCSQVIYAGLYWASAYPYERSTNGSAEWTPTAPIARYSDYNQIKFKLPTGAYNSLTADNVIFDGIATPLTSSYKNAPIICYKDVTALIQGQTNPNGTYTFANLRAAKGKRTGSSSAGWVMVIIYENPTMPSKFISTFDGYAGVANNSTAATININGFVTLPSPLPVNAKLGVAALEGDIGLTGDQLQMKGNLSPAFVNVGGGTNSLNPTNNFFNSTITDNNVAVTNRNPNGSNTLGFDLDMITLANGTKNIIKNSETGAQLKLTTSSDTYGAFLATFAVEIIEPNIKLVKKVQNSAGDDISGQNVTLSSVLDYVITFDNEGNDDAKNFTIKDILPVNTSYVSVDISDVPGCTYTNVGGVLTFTIPNNLVLKDVQSVPHSIRLRVKVAESCNDLTDACSNIIRNTAYATYAGVVNTAIISEDPSIAGINSCGIPVLGPANFLVDVSACVYSRTEVICNGSLVLTAGDGYGSYQWFLKQTTGDLPMGTTQTITVVTPGVYYYNATPIAPCIVPITETVTVTDFLNSNMPNPVIPVADEVVQCPNNGIKVPKIFLCGVNDSQYIPTGISTGVVKWQKLNATCTTTVPTDCPHNACPNTSWDTLFTGPNYTATTAGEYRIYFDPNGTGACPMYFYFNVYKNNFNPLISVKDKICTSNGEIKVVNSPGPDYQIRLISQATNTVLVDYPNTNPVFPITTPGAYTIQIKQTGVANGCTFEIKDITVLNKTMTANVITTNKTCSTSGSIRIQAYGVEPQYTFSITGPSSNSYGPVVDNNILFSGLNPGTYTVNVTTQDGCTFTSTTTINDFSNITLSATILQSISCDPGTIKLTPAGGVAPYTFAVQTINGVAQNPQPSDFTPEDIYSVTAANAGTYVFATTDANGCKVLSNPVTISNIVPTVTSSKVDATCSGINDGKITVSATGSAITYELLNSANTVIATNSSGVFPNLAPGSYTVNVIQTGTTTTCRYPYTFTIGQPSPIVVPTPTITQQYTCITGSATIAVGTPTGGTAPYSYSINGTTFSSSQTFANLLEGTYTVTVKDANGCTGTSATVTITKPVQITGMTITGTTVTCTTTTATVTVSAIVGGQSPFSYQITAPTASASNTTGVFAGLAAGTYTFTVTDAKGCTYSKPYTVAPGVLISVAAQNVNNVKCLGEANGALKFTVTNFAPNYNYTVTGGPTTVPAGTAITAATVNIPNLLAGTYTVTVTSPSTGCTSTSTVTIAAPTAVLDATVAATQPTCSAPGSAVVTATGGWGGYTYALSGAATVAANASPNFNNLAAGSYTVTVKDSNGCIITRTFTITAAVAPVLTITSSDTCIDANGTSVTATVTSATGTAPFQYKLDSGAYGAATASTTVTYTGLTTGTHTITVMDAKGCTHTVTTSNVATQITASASLTKTLDCFTSPSTADITVTIGGGTTPYQYQVSFNGAAYGALAPVTGSSFVYTVAAANAGTYKFQITGANGCTVETGTITIAPVVAPDFAFGTTTNVLCNGSSTGALTVNIDTTKGVSPYTISVTNTTTSTSYGTQTTGLPAGNYSVTVTDANGCISTHTTTITQKAPVFFTTTETNIQCVNDPANPGNTINAGEILVQGVTGGTAPYTYTLTNNFGYVAPPVTTSATSNPFIILNYGIYEAIVTDANGCTFVKSNIIMASPPNQLLIDVTSIVPATCADGGSAIVTVGAIITGVNYEFAILETNTPPYTSQAYVGPDNPAAPRTATFDNLIPGVTYTFVVYDMDTHCYYFQSNTIPATISDMVVAPLVVNPVTCTGTPDGSANFNLSGATNATSATYQVYKAQSNEIVTAPGTSGSVPITAGSGSGSVTGLPPGVYYIVFEQVGGANVGCEIASAQFTITQSPVLLTVTATSPENDNTCTTDAGTIVVTGHDGANAYIYQVVPANDPEPTTWATGNTFNLEAGFYDAYVKDANGCIKFAADVEVKLDALPTLTATLAAQCNVAEGSFAIDVTRTGVATSAGPYAYSISDGTNSSAFEVKPDSFSYTSLTSGTYTITVRDGNGCTVDALPVTIYSPLTGSAVPTAQPTCPDNDGVITAIATGGTGNYEYTLKDAANAIVGTVQTTGVFTGIASGSYTVTIEGVGTTPRCSVVVPVTLIAPITILPASVTTTQQNANCFGESNGSITVVLGTANTDLPYTYSLNGGTAQSSPTFTGLAAGAYTIVVTSGKACTYTVPVVNITEPTQLVADATATPFECAPDNSVKVSTVTVTANGTGTSAAPGYTYSIDGTNYQATNTFDVIDNGAIQTITAYITDGHGCTATDTVIINPLPVMGTPTAVVTTAIECDDNTGVITVTAVGGSGDFTFKMLPSGTPVNTAAGVSAQTFTITEPGLYTFEITDDVTHCTKTVSAAEIPEYDIIDAVATASAPVACFGSATGSVTINVDTATYSGPYTYQVFDGATPVTSGTGNTATNPFTITNLPAGNLFVTVTASNTPFCSTDTNTITVASPADALTVSAAQTGSVTCSNNLGEIVAEADGGWGAYEYELVNTTTSTTVQAFATNNVFTGLSAGNYTIRTKDSSGCTTAVVNINLPAVIPTTATISATPTALSCYGDTTATVQAVATNGQGTYEFALNIYDAAGTAIVNTTGTQTSNAFANLGAGTYSITVTDGWSCTVTTTKVTITQPNQMVASLSLTKSLTCLTPAEVTATATGGTAPYRYSTDGGTTYSTPTSAPYVVGNLSAGTYQFTVLDANNCATVLTNEVEILAVPALNLNLNASASVSCAGGANGYIAANATGGLGNYQYELLNSPTNVIAGPTPNGGFTGLVVGTYYVRVTSGDCVTTSSSIIITEPTPLNVNVVVTPIVCFGEVNGTIEITASGGTGVIQYAISPNLNQFDTVHTFTGLAAGFYDIVVQDQNGCYFAQTYEVTMPDPIDVIIVNVTDETCLGAGDATISVTISGGTGTYGISTDNITFIPVTGSSHLLTGLAAGTTTIYVKDQNNCFLNPPIDQPILPGVNMDPQVTVTTTCVNNAPNNDVTITIDGSVNPAEVTYSIDGTNYQATGQFLNVGLAPGSYTAYAKHIVPATGLTCIQTEPFTIDVHTPITAAIGTVTDVLCHADLTGSIVVNASNGTGTLQYAIANSATLPLVYGAYQTSNTFTGLAAGNYSISVKDGINCEVVLTQPVTEPATALTATVALTDESCINANDGTITVTPAGGTAAYQMSLNGGAFTPVFAAPVTFSNLADGTYTIVVRDANGCTFTTPVQTIAPGVNMNPQVTVTPTCVNNAPNNDVTIAIDASVNTAEVTYSIDGINYQSSNQFLATGLAPGNYTAYAKHIVPATGLTCIQTKPFTIDVHTPITATIGTVTNVLCHGNLTGVITVNATGGSGTVQYAIANANVLPLVYGAYQTSNTFTGLGVGNYSISVKDGINCEVIITQPISEPANALAATSAHTNEICINANDGTITVTPTGGTAPYQARINGGAYSAASSAPIVFSNLADGTYTVEVIDANGCTTTAPSQTIAPGVDLQASINAVQVCDQTTITVTVNPAVASNVTYYLDGVAQASNIIVKNGLTPGVHTITVVHSNSCSSPQLNFNVAPVIPFAAGATSSTPVLCFGGATGTATAVVTGGTGTLQYAIANAAVLPLVYGPYQASNTFTGLATGNYIINVKDQLGCQLASTTITVGQPAAALTATSAHTDEICINANDGTITVTPTGGTAPYRARINGGAYSAASSAPIVFSNLADGTYTVEVIDANGCTFTAPSQTIAPGVNLQASINAVQVCDQTTITVSVNPAVASNVTYYLDGVAQASNVIVANGLTPGTHTITVVHANSCSSPLLNFNVAPVIPIVTGTTTKTDALCFGSATGTATVTATGGTGTLQYAIANANVLPLVYGAYQASGTFTGLATGNYIINVKDQLGCQLASTTITIDQPANALDATTAHTNEICINANDGTITVTPFGGTAPYQVRINGGAYSAASVNPVAFNNLADGTYTIEVRDANGCTFIAPSQTVAPGFDLQASINVVQSCDQVTITVNVNPAVEANVTYYLDGVLQPSKNIVASGLTPGTHTVRVVHSNGCDVPFNFNVDPVTPIIVSANTIVVTPVNCHGQNSGSIQVNATGGTGPLQYALTWNIFPTQVYGSVSTFNNLIAGNYTVWVKDAMGCVVSVQNVIIDEPAQQLTVTGTSTPEVCINSHDGTITITPQGGTAPYSTAINSPVNYQQDVFTYSGLFGGTYDVFVKDARGCNVKITVNVEKGVNLNPYIQTALSCNNNLPVNTVTVLLNPVVQNVQYSIPGVQDTFAANNVFTLAPGTYTVTAKHQNGCQKAFTFTVQPRPVIVPVATAVAAKCNGAADGSISVTATGGTGQLKYGISPDYVMGTGKVFNNLVAGTYTVRVEDAYGCYTETTAVVGEPAAITITVTDVIQEICINDDNGAIEVSITGGTAPYAASLAANGPFVEDQTLFDDLDGGITYTVYVKDANGCIATIDVPLAAPLDINATANVVYECQDSTVTIVTSGGINSADLTYTLQGPAGTLPPQASNEFKNLPDGAYTVEVVHTSGCSDTASFTIESVPALALSLSPNGLNKFTASVTGGKGPYTYVFEGNDVGSKNTFVYYHSGRYEVSVVDSRGCTVTAFIDVTFIDIIIPDVVSPDGNGNNDTWSPGNTQNYPGINTDVFDRYGRKLGTLKQGQEWDCTYEGHDMPSGDYWYLIKLNDPEGREFVGHFTIYR